MQTKRNLKLYALTCMQTNNRNRKHKNYPSPILRKAFLFKERKLREGEQKKTISPGKVQSTPKLYGLVIIRAHGASATPS